MKKYLIFYILCGLQTASAAFAADLSPYQYNPKQPPVEVYLDALDEVEAPQKLTLHPPSAAPQAAAPVIVDSAATSKPLALTLPAPAPQPQTRPEPPPEKNIAVQEEASPEGAPASHTAEFLDKIMTYHLPEGAKRKPVKEIKTIPSAKPAPAPSAAETPQTEKPAETIKPAETKPVEEKPTEAKPVEEKPAETKPVKEEATPAVQERRSRRREPTAAIPTHEEMTVVFDKNSSELSTAAEKNLDAIVTQLKDLPDLRIQLRAYATSESGNQSDARRMSLSRGLMVRSYLIDKGVKPASIDVRALGAEGDKPPSDQVEVVFVK